MNTVCESKNGNYHPRIYIDQNHWISLAQAYFNHQDGEKYKHILLVLKKLTNCNKISVPMSGIHIEETLAISDLNRRSQLATVFTEISCMHSMLPYFTILEEEVKNAVNCQLGEMPVDLRVRIFNQGWEKALNITDMIDNYFGKSRMITNIKFFWPESLNMIFYPLFKNMPEKAIILLIKYSRKHSREMNYLNLHRTFQAFIQDYHYYKFYQNPQKQIIINDIRDMDFLATAIPYCDIVVIDKHFAELAKLTKLDETYNTQIYWKLEQLSEALNNIH